MFQLVGAKLHSLSFATYIETIICSDCGIIYAFTREYMYGI